MKKTFTKITIVTLALMITLLFSAVGFASTPLQDGQYTINASAVNATNGSPSMADGSITKPLKLEVVNGKINVILEMKTDMYDLAVQNSAGNFVLAEELSENETTKTITYKFPVSTINEPALVEVVVGAMGRKVNFKLAFEPSTLVNVTPATPATNTNTTNTNTATKVANPKTGYNPFTSISMVVLIATILTAVVYGLNKNKIATNK